MDGAGLMNHSRGQDRNVREPPRTECTECTECVPSIGTDGADLGQGANRAHGVLDESTRYRAGGGTMEITELAGEIEKSDQLRLLFLLLSRACLESGLRIPGTTTLLGWSHCRIHTYLYCTDQVGSSEGELREQAKRQAKEISGVGTARCMSRMEQTTS